MTALALDTAQKKTTLVEAPSAPEPGWEQLARIGFVNYRAVELWCTRACLAPEDDAPAIRSS